MNINNDVDNNGDDAGNDITIRGLVFQNGAFPGEDGAGGLAVTTGAAETVIEGCTIRNNTGGGVYLLSNTGGLTLSNNVFNSNELLAKCFR